MHERLSTQPCPSCDETEAVVLQSQANGGDYCKACGWSEMQGEGGAAKLPRTSEGEKDIILVFGNRSGFNAYTARNGGFTTDPTKAKRYTAAGLRAYVYGKGGYGNVPRDIIAIRIDGQVSAPSILARSDAWLTKPNWRGHEGLGWEWLTNRFISRAFTLSGSAQ